MVPLIASLINGHLGLPEDWIRARYPPLLARMTMPKATFHEHYRTIFWQDQIWPARQVADMQAKPKSLLM